MKTVKSFALAIFAFIGITACTNSPTAVVNTTPSPNPSASGITASASPVPVASPTAMPAVAPLQQLITDVENATTSVAVKSTLVSATTGTTYRPGTASTVSVGSYLSQVGDTAFIMLKRGDTTGQTVTAEKQSTVSVGAKAAAEILQRLYKDGGNVVEYDSADWKTAYMVVKNLDKLEYVREKGEIKNAAGGTVGTYEILMMGDPIYDKNHSARVTLKAVKDFNVNVNTAPQKMVAGNTAVINIDTFKFLDKPEISISTNLEEEFVLKPYNNPFTGEVYPVVTKRVFTRVSLEDVRVLIESNMLSAAAKK